MIIFGFEWTDTNRYTDKLTHMCSDLKIDRLTKRHTDILTDSRIDSRTHPHTE